MGVAETKIFYEVKDMEIVLDGADSKILGNQLHFMVHQNF